MTLRVFTDAYLETVAFVPGLDEQEEEGNPEWSDAMIATLKGDAAAFFAANEDDIHPYGVSEAGHDFWLTRNGHGAGFWENDHGTPEICARLDAAAKAAGPCWLYLGDDGMIHADREGGAPW